MQRGGGGSSRRPSPQGGRIRPYIGRDKSRARVSVEVKGKEVAQRVARRTGGAVAFFLKHDWVVRVNRRPLAEISPKSDGEAEVPWNAAVVASAGVPKVQIVADFARLLPAQPEWAL